jgi:hypothetical protein
MAKGEAYLVGKLDEDTPLSLEDPAGDLANPDSLPLIDRKTLEQLVLAGYLRSRLTQAFTSASGTSTVAGTRSSAYAALPSRTLL